jgi:hypothetical protein
MADGYSCYLFSEIPGVWSKWTLAVFATSKRDAYDYMKAYHGGGKCVGEVKSGNVQADCGAVTESAQSAISAQVTNARIA